MSGDDLYRDPTLYDLEYGDKVDDIAYYVEMARRSGGPVLELGCGNGRLLLPLAEAGLQVTGVDRNATMLDDLSRKQARLPAVVQRRIRVQRADFTALPDLGRFPLVLLPFNALHHCADHHAVLSLLDGVRRSLAPGGRFALDCYLPDPDLYAREPGQRHEARDFTDPRTGQRLQTWEAGWYDALAQVHHVVYVYRDHAGREYRVQLDLRMFYPQELLALLDLGGFRVLQAWADFDRTPLDGSSLGWVGILEAR
jgi:SAM-dependent methyltransferase